MFDLLRKTFFGAIAAVSVMVIMPLAAGAATVDPSSNIANGGAYDMVAGPYSYGETFVSSDVAGVRNFTFNNLNAVSQNIMLTTATVNALRNMFTGGITFQWLTSGASLFVAQATTSFSGTLDNLIAAGGSDTLRITFGDPERRLPLREGRATFDVQLDAVPVPIPVPAAGLLLLGALGGLAALRRRKMAA